MIFRKFGQYSLNSVKHNHKRTPMQRIIWPTLRFSESFLGQTFSQPGLGLKHPWAIMKLITFCAFYQVFNVITIYYTVQLVRSVPNITINHPAVVSSATNLVLCLYAGVPLLLAFWWQYKGYIPKLCAHLHNANNGRGVLSNKYHLIAIQVFGAIALALSTFSFVQNILTLGLLQMQNISLLKLFLMLPYTPWLLILLVCIPLCTACYLEAATSEMTFFNAELETFTQQPDPPSSNQIIALMIRHNHLHQAITELDGLFSLHILIYVALSIPLIVLVGYSALASHGFDSKLGYQQALTIVVFLVVTWYPARLTEATAVAPTLVSQWRSVLASGDHELVTLLNAFLHQCTHVAAIDLCGIGALNKGFIVTIVSAVVTYLTLLIQFYNPEELTELYRNQTAGF